MQYSSCLLSILSIVLLLAPAAARAEPLHCRVTGLDGGGTILAYRCSAPVPCSTVATCDPTVFGDRAVCQAFDERTGEPFCRAECSTILGCDETSDCARLGSATPQCVPFEPSDGGEPSGLCLYPTLGITYCADAPPTVIDHYWMACHTLPGGGVTSNYFDGDCDGDGCANGEDSTPCIAGDGPCVPRTRGPLCGTAMALDAGVGSGDGGTSADAGATTEPDGGNATTPDAGEDEDDAGTTVELDAGERGEMDAGGAPPGIGFNGGGGCRCGVPGRGSAPGGALGIGLLALLALARRRNRQ
jgi:MYXO-CTERM domain-containing protein